MSVTLIHAASASELAEADRPRPVSRTSSDLISDATERTRVEEQQHAGVPPRRVRAVEGAGRLLHTLRGGNDTTVTAGAGLTLRPAISPLKE
jgi:hypothetical protein